MRPERVQTYAQGMVTGLVGYATVAIYFVVANLLAGRSPFHTAALLGSALFYGLRNASDLVIAPGPILAYNGVHLLVFLALGMLAAWLAYLAEKAPHLWYVGAVVFIFISFHMFSFFLFFTAGIREALSAWNLMGAGVLACLAMAAYLYIVHPRLHAELRDYPV